MTDKWFERWRWIAIVMFAYFFMFNIYRLGQNHPETGLVLFSLAIDTYFLFYYLLYFGDHRK